MSPFVILNEQPVSKWIWCIYSTDIYIYLIKIFVWLFVSLLRLICGTAGRILADVLESKLCYLSYIICYLSLRLGVGSEVLICWRLSRAAAQ